MLFRLLPLSWTSVVVQRRDEASGWWIPRAKLCWFAYAFALSQPEKAADRPFKMMKPLLIFKAPSRVCSNRIRIRRWIAAFGVRFRCVVSNRVSSKKLTASFLGSWNVSVDPSNKWSNYFSLAPPVDHTIMPWTRMATRVFSWQSSQRCSIVQHSLLSRVLSIYAAETAP